MIADKNGLGINGRCSYDDRQALRRERRRITNATMHKKITFLDLNPTYSAADPVSQIGETNSRQKKNGKRLGNEEMREGRRNMELCKATQRLPYKVEFRGDAGGGGLLFQVPPKWLFLHMKSPHFPLLVLPLPPSKKCPFP